MSHNRPTYTAHLLPALSLAALLSLTTAAAAPAHAQAAPQAPAPSLTGKWKVHIAIGGNEQDQKCSFTQTGNALAGTCITEQGEAKIAGSLDGGKITWKFDSDYQGTPITLIYTGAFDAKGKLSGSVEVQPFNVTGDFDVSAADAAAAAPAGSSNAPVTVAAPSASAASTSAGPIASLTGTWHMHTTVSGTDYDSDCTITQTDKAIAGTCKNDNGEVKIAGTVDGNKATWKFDSDYQGTPINLTYTGAFDDKGKFSGTVDVAPFNVSGDFLMTPKAK